MPKSTQEPCPRAKIEAVRGRLSELTNRLDAVLEKMEKNGLETLDVKNQRSLESGLQALRVFTAAVEEGYDDIALGLSVSRPEKRPAAARK